MTQAGVSSIVAKLDELQTALDTNRGIMEFVKERQEKVLIDVYGNGKPGLKADVHDLRAEIADLRSDVCQLVDSQKWLSRLVIGAVVVAALGALFVK